MNWFSKIKEGLSKTRTQMVESIKEAVSEVEINDDILEELEEILITADLGVNTAMELTERIRRRAKIETITGEDILPALREELNRMIGEGQREEVRQGQRPKPYVTFVVGVNGTGKTTTIGKLAKKYANAGQSVLIVAADTFRQAAVEQVAIWAERAGVDIVRGSTGADPGAVIYDGLQAALNRGVDRVLVDTAGRLHTKANLMAELGKIERVAKKLVPDAPHEVLLVVDGTTGQNGLSQAKTFSQTIPVSALVVTKLDGTAKGGVLVPIGRELGIPVRWIGVGEGIDDLAPFNGELIVEAVFGDEESLALQERIQEAKELEEIDENLKFDLEGGMM